jgi:hypothetical protein
MGQLVFQATLGGQVNLVGPNTASTFNLNVPAVSSTLATLTGTETFTNKTLTSPTLTTPVLGTPSSGTLTSCTGLPLTTGVTGTLAVANGGTGVTTSTGSGNSVLSTSPTITTPVISSLSSASATALTLQSAGTTGISINTAGLVTKPNQPIFAAYRTSSQTGTSPFTIVFDTANLNVGSNYSTSTGRFTAPIAGNYYLIFQTLGITGVWNSLDIILYKNGSSAPTILSARPTSTAGTETPSNLSTAFGIVTLAASDYVEIKVSGTTIYSDSNAWLKFGGWLVC